jgi:hypothetical protein
MKKILITLSLLSMTALTNLCFSSEDDFYPCTESSIKAEYDERSNAYISRGEDLLLSGRFEDSIGDLSMGYELTVNGSEENKDANCMRSLFGMLIAYGHLEDVDSIMEVSKKMHSIMDSPPCCSRNYKYSD